MRPDFDLRLRTMMKAMTEVVLPAIDPDNSAAIEQASLVAGSINLLMEQVDYGHWFAVADIYSHAGLLNELLSMSGLALDEEPAQWLKEAKTTAGRWDVTLSELDTHGQKIRDIVSMLVERVALQQDKVMLAKMTETVLNHSLAQLNRERAFVEKTNFDVNPETLLSLDAAMQKYSPKPCPPQVSVGL